MIKGKFWVYILNCIDGSYYTGYTTDLIRRYTEHMSQNGKGSKYTRGFKPLGIAQCWYVNASKSDALKIEYFIKKLSKNKKLQLILYPEILMEKFDCVPLLYAKMKCFQLSSRN